VWNRQRTDFDLADPADTALGHRQVQRWNLPEGWGHLKASRACGAGQRGLRAMRPAAGISLVQRQTRLPVPPRLHQRHPPATRTAGNTYVREDQILPHLAAIAILLAGPPRTPARGNRRPAQATGPDGTAALIDQLRAGGVVLTYDPQGRTLRARGRDALSVTIGKDH
jgi:hypothetical protein